MIPRDVAALFPASTRSRGMDYFAAGRVALKRQTEDGVWEARVTGSRLYDVWVAPGGVGEFGFSCDCPFFLDHDYCKHVWATLLAVEVSGATRRDAARQGALPARLALVSAPRHGTQPARRPPRPPAPPPWSRTLEAARYEMGPREPSAEATGWPENRRINYIIDLPRTQYARALVVELATQAADRHGGWRPPKRFSYSHARWLACPDALDREIARLLIGARVEWAQRPQTPSGGFAIDPAAYDPILRLMCETGRCRVRSERNEADPEPIAWDGGPPWEFHLRLAAGGDRVSARGVLRRPGSDDRALDGALGLVGAPEPAGSLRPLGAAPLGAAPVGAALLEVGLVILDGRIAPVDHFGAFPLAAALAQAPLDVARKDLPRFLHVLHDLPYVPPLEADPALGIREVRSRPVPRAAITMEDAPTWQPPQGAPVELAFDYDGVVLPCEPDGPPHFEPEGMRLVHRDAAAERDALERLRALGAVWRHDYQLGRKRPHLPVRKVPEAVDALTREGWRVEWEGRPVRHATSFAFTVSSGIDWFDLTANVDFGGLAVTLPQLLAGLREGGGVALPDGSVGLLPEEWRERCAALAGIGEPGEHGLRFRPSQVALLDALPATLPNAQVDEVFRRARERLAAFEGVRPAAAPPGFTGELRHYQREGLGWLDFVREFGFGGCLADDMGLGKTVQVLALLQARRRAGAGASLAVVPRSLITNWEREAARFTPGLRVLDHSGAGRRREALDPSSFDLMLTTYGVLRREAAALRDVEFDYVILDEAQAIKNAATASAKAARLLNGRHRLVVTGTPVENRLADLWSLFEFLNPGMLSAGLLRVLTGGGNGGQLDEARRALLARALRPFILRRTKAQVAPELPERLEQTLYVDLEPAQRELYDELRDHYRASLLGRVDRLGVGRSRIQILEALLRLRQAACHPGLLDPKRAADAGGKLEVVQERLLEAAEEGHKVLVFSQFTSLLALLRTRLDAAGLTYEYLDGRTRDRQQRVDRFQSDAACPAFLISLKAGGQGLNLTAAEYVFLLDPWWNPAVEAQAIDRAHRIGQTRRVFATRLIARDTVEEKVLELQQSKRHLADAIITQDNSVIAKIEREDLEFLLS